MKHANDSNYDELVSAPGVGLVYFTAQWCGPCRHLSPLIDQLDSELEGVNFVKVDVDLCHGVSTRLGIRSIPTVLILKDGEVVDRSVGSVPKSTIEDKVRKQL
jgi:thioredoxin 1